MGNWPLNFSLLEKFSVKFFFQKYKNLGLKSPSEVNLGAKLEVRAPAFPLLEICSCLWIGLYWNFLPPPLPNVLTHNAGLWAYGVNDASA